MRPAGKAHPATAMPAAWAWPPLAAMTLERCQQPLAAGTMVTMTGYQVVPIGWVESPLSDRAQAPRQADEGAPSAWLVFEPEVADGLRDLAAGAEIIVV